MTRAGGYVRALLPTGRDYRSIGRTWRGDLLAGLTVGIVALPLALGFGIASGAGAAAGLITAIVAGVIAAVFGGSNVQVSGPTGAMVVVLAPIVAAHGMARGCRGERARRDHGADRRGCATRARGVVHSVAGDRGLHPRHRDHHLPAAGARPHRGRCRQHPAHERRGHRGVLPRRGGPDLPALVTLRGRDRRGVHVPAAARAPIDPGLARGHRPRHVAGTGAAVAARGHRGTADALFPRSACRHSRWIRSRSSSCPRSPSRRSRRSSRCCRRASLPPSPIPAPTTPTANSSDRDSPRSARDCSEACRRPVRSPARR